MWNGAAGRATCWSNDGVGHLLRDLVERLPSQPDARLNSEGSRRNIGECEVVRAEGALNDADRGVNSGECDMGGAECEVNRREWQLNGAESAVHTRESERNMREPSVNTPESEVSGPECEMSSRESEVSSPECEMNNPELEVSSRESHVNSRETEVHRRESLVNTETRRVNRPRSRGGRTGVRAMPASILDCRGGDPARRGSAHVLPAGMQRWRPCDARCSTLVHARTVETV